MRVIEFRGKDEQGKWIYGNLVRYTEDDGEQITCIVSTTRCKISAEVVFVVVNPDTVGQYIGLKDKHGNKIYEGDIIKHVGGMRRNEQGEWVDNPEFMTVEYIDARFNVDFYSKCTFSIEVIGNIHDNPELIKQ